MLFLCFHNQHFVIMFDVFLFDIGLYFTKQLYTFHDKSQIWVCL